MSAWSLGSNDVVPSGDTMSGLILDVVVITVIDLIVFQNSFG